MSESFMPHGMCFLWRSDLLWLHVLSDAGIALAYFSIPMALVYFVRRRSDLEYKWVLALFAAFIVACGITHLFGLWVIWNPDYYAEGVAKAVTAAISIATAILLWPLLPKLLALPSPAQLRTANESLEKEVQSRIAAQRRLEELNADLERRVAARTRELELSNQELEKFASLASHDMKAPLRAINQCSQWIEADLEGSISTEVQENLDMMRSRIRRMERMLDDLLDYSRVGNEAGGHDDTRVPAADLLADVLELASPPDSFTVEVSSDFEYLRLPLMPLKQILLNLVANAVKHHDRPDGHISIDVADAGEFHAISVTDDGPGIDEKFHNDVFEMFRTLRPRDQVEGSGVGLAIVRKAAERFGGRVELESAPGEGSRFTVYWPKSGPD